MRPRVLIFAVVLSAVTVAVGPAAAGCAINLGVENTGSSSLWVQGELSKVKSRGGTWRRLGASNWAPTGASSFHLQSGGTAIDVYNATFGCGKKRRYRIVYECGSGANRSARTTHYPGASSWTKNQSPTIGLSCDP